MRIALLHPTYWPEVRRGSERLIHDLGAELARRGHEVTLLTTHRHAPGRTLEDGIEVRRAWRPPTPPGLTTYEYHLVSVPITVARLVRGRFDVAHSFFPSDSWAAVRARRLGGPPVVSTLHGIPSREYLVARRHRLEMLLAVAREAGECSVLSEAARAAFRAYLLRDPVILPGGVDASQFAPVAPRSAGPTIFCPASLGDPRKRGPVLARAFELLRERVPDVKLRAATGADPVMSGASIALPSGAESAALVDDAALARAYSAAWVTVLPSVQEAFGLVLVESLAAGTPVVAARSGACPEILTAPEHGRLFEPDDPDDLARALGEALELPRDGEAARRARAAEFDWSVVTNRYEAVYEAVLAAAA